TTDLAQPSTTNHPLPSIPTSSNFCNNHPALSINPFLLHFRFERAPPYGDQASDQDAIRQGFKYYEKAR
ncbi:MAG: hypothetical protein M0P19_14355, partial [Nevskia sp.]|nr:hypothetical protein [Nevskia sp.]